MLLQPTPKQVFQVDALGACLTSIFTGFLLANNQDIFGLPHAICVQLALGACGLAIFSFWSAATTQSAWRLKLRIIATANLAYALVTVTLLLKYWPAIKPIGVAYFIGEIVVIISLVLFEWVFSMKKS